MNVHKADQFLADAEHQFLWYLSESHLDTSAALDLAERFIIAVDSTIDFLTKNPEAGWPCVISFSELPGFRSWRVNPPFNRFLIFYRIQGADRSPRTAPGRPSASRIRFIIK